MKHYKLIKGNINGMKVAKVLDYDETDVNCVVFDYILNKTDYDFKDNTRIFTSKDKGIFNRHRNVKYLNNEFDMLLINSDRYELKIIELDEFYIIDDLELIVKALFRNYRNNKTKNSITVYREDNKSLFYDICINIKKSPRNETPFLWIETHENEKNGCCVYTLKNGAECYIRDKDSMLYKITKNIFDILCLKLKGIECND